MSKYDAIRIETVLNHLLKFEVDSASSLQRKRTEVEKEEQEKSGDFG